MDKGIPKGAFNIHLFNLFNAISFQIVLGAPLILYARSLGASSTVLGLLSAFLPLTMVMQLPASRMLHVYGYKKFVLAGWSTRIVFIFFLAAIPPLSFLNATTKLVLIVVILFVFNVLRGTASTAWMPWIATLIPEESRARFLSRDQIFVILGSIVSLGVSCLFMSGQVDPLKYAAIFLLSGCAGMASLFFIKKTPDADGVDQMKASSEPVPWLEILLHPHFLRLLTFNLFSHLWQGAWAFSPSSFFMICRILTSRRSLC